MERPAAWHALPPECGKGHHSARFGGGQGGNGQRDGFRYLRAKMCRKFMI